MLGVCRGKISEGYDFKDEFARAIIVVSIPYKNIKDVKVVLKE